jgi:dipeptidyl aminopeptidase/acylaminoacyl peptidase
VDVFNWIADEGGTVRLGLGYRNRRLNIYYRENDQAEFERIARIKRGDAETFFEAIQIITGTSRGYVLEENDDGKVGVRIFDYATREVVETFYEHPEWDIEDVWLEDGEPIAAFYTDDSRKVVWFNEDDQRVYDELTSAILDRRVWVTSRSKNGERLLVWAGNEADPGVLYLYDRKNKSLKELAQYRPEVNFQYLARPQPFTYQARDGTDIRGYLTLPKGREAKGLPLIILPHGGPFGIRDTLSYNDEVQFLANRGYAVIQPNFRGSGGYGSSFYELGNGEVGRGMQDDLDDAMEWAVREGIADPSRVCVVGGSYGGYAALWAVLRNPERYRCAASWAGVTDWDRMLKYDRRYLTRRAGKRWSAQIEGDDDFDLKDVSPFRLAKGLSRPVLLAHGTADDNVPFKQYEQMVKAARKAPVPLTTLVIEKEGHGFSKKESEQQWYDALDAFLAKHNPADQIDANGELLPAPALSLFEVPDEASMGDQTVADD